MTDEHKVKQSLRTKIYLNLKQRIEAGQWDVESKLPSESQLCREYGVSRITVRAAIQQLEAIGLVRTQQGGRTTVLRTRVKGHYSALNPLQHIDLHPDIITVLEYRIVMEKGTIGLAAQRITDEDLTDLEAIFNMMLTNHDNIKKFSEADYLFHRKIAECSKNQILILASAGIEEVLANTMDSIVSLIGCAIGIRYHRELISALRLRDKDRCERLMEEHIQATIKAIQEYREFSRPSLEEVETPPSR